MDHDTILDSLEIETSPFSLCELTPRGRLAMPRSQIASLHYILAGRGSLHVAGRPAQPVAAGDLVLVPAALRHALGAEDGAFVTLAQCRPAALGLRHHRVAADDDAGDAAGGAGLSVLCAYARLGLRGAGPVIDLLRAPIIETGTGGGVSARALDLLIAELSNPGPGSRAMIRTLLMECLIDLLRRRIGSGDPTLAWIGALGDRRLWPALAAMLDAPGAGHSVEDLAARVAMSRSRFAERFRSAFGAGPMEILRGLRLQHAARLLAESDAGVARVAELAGYASRSHFTQAFTEGFGITPARFRHEARR